MLSSTKCQRTTKSRSPAPSPSPPPPFPSVSISLTLRYTRRASRSEITAVGISPSSTVAYAIFPGAQADQPWIDTFDLATQRGYSKIIGPVASFSPSLHSSPLRVGKPSASAWAPGKIA